MDHNKVNNPIKVIFLPLLAVVAIFLFGCELTDPSDVILPGKLKVELVYKASDGYVYHEGDFLLAEARDFKIFNDNYYTDVFQRPDQFLQSPDSIVNYNLMRATAIDTVIQVAYGSIPPFEYDSLFFQVTPMDFVILDNRGYPVSTNYYNLPIENDFSKVVKIRSKIKVKENKTTTLRIEFKLEENLFRILDDFVFSAKVDTFYILNE